MDCSPSHQRLPLHHSLGRQLPSSQVTANGLLQNTASAAASQHNMPLAKIPGAPMVSEPSPEAVAKYFGAALQTHTLKVASPAADVSEMVASSQPEGNPLDIAIQVNDLE
jgi:hypothetical protein